MDEHDGRAAARAMGLKPIGILGILLKAKHSESIESVKRTLEALRKDAGFYISPDLEEAVLKAAGEG